jgi:hypothetical protein
MQEIDMDGTWYYLLYDDVWSCCFREVKEMIFPEAQHWL